MAKIVLTIEDGDDEVVRGQECQTSQMNWEFYPPMPQVKIEGSEELRFPGPHIPEVWDQLTPAQRCACVADFAIRMYRASVGGSVERQTSLGEQDLN